MSVVVSRLRNGLTVVSHARADVETVSLGLWIGAGSRSEDLPEHGVAHFLEHMAFKGTDRRSAQAIAEEIEAVGGELNAATGVDSTAYYARVLRQDFGLALDILSDIILA
ncbi:MAG TPA: insulinase family protein, partial [Methyloceanibacter sp.]